MIPEDFRNGEKLVFVATVLLASQIKTPEWGMKQEKDPALNEMRMDEMKQILRAVHSGTEGDGVVVFPGGWFHSGYDPARSLFQWIREEITSDLGTGHRNIIVVLGIDGSFDRPADQDPYDRDQMSLALDRTGIIAIGRKFFPGNDERRFIHAATGYLDLEEGMPRIFSLNGTKFFLFECNDIKAPYHNAGKFKNPGIDVGLNLIHRINEKGQPLSQENNFACIFGARTSYEWRIPVFLSVIFFRKTVPDCWPSGVLCTRATNYRVGYDEIRLSDSSHEVVPVAEGYAAVRIFRNLRSQILQKNETSHADEAAPAKNSGMGAIPVSKDQEGNKRQPRKDQFTIPAGKYRPRFEDVIRNFRSVVPENRKMKLTSSKSNCIILEDGLPEGIRYEFDDWQDRISIEIDLSPALSPQYEKNLSDLAHLEIEGLPVPELSKQTNGWLRLQYFFPENVPVPELVKAMNVLIEKSSMIFCTR